jgi:prolyl-tRNA editing enzyme YbaK/EbsC (Cys-tRNA(Pro) deacylase)
MSTDTTRAKAAKTAKPKAAKAAKPAAAKATPKKKAATPEEITAALAKAKIDADGLSMKDLAAKTGLPESRLIKAYYAGVDKTGPVVVVKVGRNRFRGTDKPAAKKTAAKKAAPAAKGFVPTEEIVAAKTVTA